MPGQSGRWVLLLVLVSSALFWLLGWYGDTVQTMVATWLSSETFAHGFIILPISLWLVWRRRWFVQRFAPHPNFWMLIPLAMAALVWLLANLGSVAVVQQYALVIMILFMIATILGNEVVRQIAFPLLFLLFAVPFGEVLLPLLMEQTADFTVFALRLTGIPVYRDGLYFALPSGSWSVIEACSGLRYLIASVTLGVLYAYLTYRSPRRRAIFVLLSIIVPIVANWLRAYMIVMIGHLTTMKHAAGVDHLIYGWVFFGVVMAILFWAGAYWREDSASGEIIPNSPARNEPLLPFAWKAILPATLAAAGIVAAAPALASHLQGHLREQFVLDVPRESPEWQRVPDAATDWTPRFMNPSARIVQTYARSTRPVQLFIWYYRNQRPGAQLISSRNTLVQSADPIWAIAGSEYRTLNVRGSEIKLIESKLRSGNSRLLVWHWYWIDGQYTSNAYWAKLLQARSMLMGRGDSAAAIIVAAPYSLNPSEVVDQLQDFLGSMIPAVADVLQPVR